MVMDEVNKKFWSANEIGKKDDEMQDLKLENDRLKQREDLLLKAVKSIGCAYNTCHGCLYENGETCGSYAEYTRLCRHVLKELEEL